LASNTGWSHVSGMRLAHFLQTDHIRGFQFVVSIF
jgi:hypothetical protein